MPMNVHRGNQVFVVFLAALALVGGLLGYSLARYPKLETAKLLNIAGLTYNLIGIVVLSEAVAQSEKLKAFMVKWVAGFLIWAQSVVPLGAVAGAWIGSSFPSSKIAASFFASFFAYSIFVLAIIDSTVFFPRYPQLQNPSLRTRTFGLVLLLTGVVMQLVAAFKDLNS